LGKTKSEDYPNGLAHEFVAKAKKANKPSDASAMIKLEIELEKLQLKGTRNFYNDVDSQRAGIKVEPTRKKSTFLPSKAMDHSRESAGTVVKCAVTRMRTVRNLKGSCMVVAATEIMRAIQAQTRRAIFVA
jgi:hypothetical protein